MRFLFQGYVLDIDRRELTRGTEQVSVAPKVFDLLVYLVQNRARVVSKDDLLEAVWARRIVSESTLTSHMNAARKAIGDTGEEQNLIRTVARKGFRFVGDVRDELRSNADSTVVCPTGNDSEHIRRSVSAPALPDRPSIAVLPFQNMSGDPEQEYFADGIVDEIITELSRIRWLFVIARNSSFTYKGRSIDVKHVGRELGVRYILEGSVRKAANRVRIIGQLVDATTGVHLWADRFEGAVEDIFDLQDQATASVISAIAPKVERAEIERAKRKPTESLDAYDYYLRGMANYYLLTREAVDEALSQFYKAIELDPNFASAYGMAAWCFGWHKINGWLLDRVNAVAETERLARRATEIGFDDAVALSRAAHALAFVVEDMEGSRTFVDRALALNSNLAGAWLASGYTRIWLGEPDVAINHFAQAIRLSPLDPQTVQMQAGTALAHFIGGRYDEAASWAEMGLWAEANYHSPLRTVVASYALTGRLAEAKKMMGRLREREPELRISNLKYRLPFRRLDDLDRLKDALRIAGLPE